MLKIRRLVNVNLDPEWLDEIDVKLAIKYYTLFSKVNGEVSVITSEEHLNEALSFISKINLSFKIYVADQGSFERLYHKFLEMRTDSEMSSISEQTDDKSDSDEVINLVEFLKTSQDLLSSEASAPIIKFVNSLFFQAIKRRASDIHIEPHERKGIVRFRIDGTLVNYLDLDKNIFNLIISRIKVISNLDISEKRVPQDGRTSVKISGKVLDIRISILPTYYGERCVMRILMQSSDIPSLEELGFNDEMTAEFRKLLKHSHGMILVTGPTGSGKSTTLHSFLQTITKPETNIITVEDPVEYNAENINQVQVNSKVGLSFASGLRSILRQDPDVIMVGEIRDAETAEIAIQSALTGHLLLSTLHTNNSLATITRLIDMGVEPFLISSSLIGVLAQRLVKKICPHCKEENILAEEFAEEFGFPKWSTIYTSNGCSVCNFTGFIGRRAIGEIFIVDDEVKKIIKDVTNEHELREIIIKKGFKTLQDELKDMVLSGETSLEEAIRVGLKDN